MSTSQPLRSAATRSHRQHGTPPSRSAWPQRARGRVPGSAQPHATMQVRPCRRPMRFFTGAEGASRSYRSRSVQGGHGDGLVPGAQSSCLAWARQSGSRDSCWHTCNVHWPTWGKQQSLGMSMGAACTSAAKRAEPKLCKRLACACALAQAGVWVRSVYNQQQNLSRMPLGLSSTPPHCTTIGRVQYNTLAQKIVVAHMASSLAPWAHIGR